MFVYFVNNLLYISNPQNNGFNTLCVMATCDMYKCCKGRGIFAAFVLLFKIYIYVKVVQIFYKYSKSF